MAASFTPAADPPRTPSINQTYRSPINTVSGRIILDVADEIPFYEPSAAPLTAFMLGIKKMKKATQRKFEHFEKDPYPASATVASTVTAGNTTVNVTAGQGARFRANDLVVHRKSGQVFLVSSIATDALTVVADPSGVGTNQFETGDELEIIGSAFEDGADIGALRSTAETNIYNYLQIFRHAFGWSRRQASTDMYGGSDPDLEIKAQGIEHKKQIEKALFFGARFSRTGAGGHEQTGTGGLSYFVSTNDWNLNDTEPTERQLVESLEHGMRWGKNSNVGGGGSKILYASRRWMTYFDKLGRDRIRYVDMGELLGRGRIGLKVGEFHTVHGMLTLTSHPLFVGEHGGKAFLVDPAELSVRYHQGGNGFPDGRTKLLEDRQGNGVDGEYLEYMSDLGLQVSLEAAHMKWRGLKLSQGA